MHFRFKFNHLVVMAKQDISCFFSVRIQYYNIDKSTNGVLSNCILPTRDQCHPFISDCLSSSSSALVNGI